MSFASLLLSAALLSLAGPAVAGDLYEKYVGGILYATPHTIEFLSDDSSSVFFETTHTIGTFVADPERGLYGISTSTHGAVHFYLIDIRRLHGKLLSRKRTVMGKDAFRFEDITLSYDGNFLRRKDGSLDQYEVTYYDTKQKIKLDSPPDENVWIPGPWFQEAFDQIVYRDPNSGKITYTIGLSSTVSGVRLFPDRDDVMILFSDGTPPALYSLNPFQAARTFPASLTQELRANRLIDWCPGGRCVLLQSNSEAYLYYPETDRRIPVPDIKGACDDLRTRQVAGVALLLECRDSGRYTAVLAEIPFNGDAPIFERLPVPDSPRVYYQWKGLENRTWLTANFNKILKDTRRKEAQRKARRALKAARLAALEAKHQATLRAAAQSEAKNPVEDPLIGQIAALFHVGILGSVALHLKGKRKND